jgi:D-arabinonate dehydratase
VHIHLVSAIPNGLILEYYRGSTNPMWGKTFKSGLKVEDEYVFPPDRPGMGIEVNEEALAQYRVN